MSAYSWTRAGILPGLPLDLQLCPADRHDLVARAVQIARTSDDDYLRHPVEIQLTSGPPMPQSVHGRPIPMRGGFADGAIGPDQCETAARWMHTVGSPPADARSAQSCAVEPVDQAGLAGVLLT